MLEFLASCIGPWIDLIENNLPPFSCTLSQTDSTTTAGWLRKSNFKDDNENEIHEHCKLNLARDHASRLLSNDIKEYSQWFPGNKNKVADSLSRDFHINDCQLTKLFYKNFQSQMPVNFNISPMPPEIVSWICSWLQKMPKNQQSQEIQTRSKIGHGIDGENSSTQSKSTKMIFSKNFPNTSKLDYSVHSHSQSETENILKHLEIPWLLQHSAIPWTMWLCPSGTINTLTQDSMILANLHAFYRSSTKATKIRINHQDNKKYYLSTSSNNYLKTNPQIKQKQLEI